MNEEALREAHDEANEMADRVAAYLEGQDGPINIIEVAASVGLKVDAAELAREGVDLTVYPIRALPWFYWFPWRWWWCWWWNRRYPYYKHPWAWCWCHCYNRRPYWY